MTLHPAQHSTGRALLYASCRDPLDDTPRLVLADWLDENDDPAWAEYLRLCLRLPACRWEQRCSQRGVKCRTRRARASGGIRRRDKRRAAQLLATHASRWLWPFGESKQAHFFWRRGLPYGVVLPVKQYLARAQLLFSLFPLIHLRLLYKEMPPLLWIHDRAYWNYCGTGFEGDAYLCDGNLTNSDFNDVVPGPLFDYLYETNVPLVTRDTDVYVPPIAGKPRLRPGLLAVSRAAVAYGRAQANLPPLAWPPP